MRRNGLHRQTRRKGNGGQGTTAKGASVLEEAIVRGEGEKKPQQTSYMSRQVSPSAAPLVSSCRLRRTMLAYICGIIDAGGIPDAAAATVVDGSNGVYW